MSDEELTALEEELAAARAELERLQMTAADRDARASYLEAELAQAREERASAQNEATSREDELAAARRQHEALRGQVQSSAQRYRELALQHSPELPADLVVGDTVEEIEAALQQARETVARVRGHLEQQAQAGRVPVGAPPRGAPDVSGLSAEEKIRMGLQQGGL